VKDLETPQTVGELIQLRAQVRGSHPAIIDGEQQLSFVDLYQQSCRVARALMALGIAKGDRVAIWSPNIWEWVVVALGIESIGGILTPINTRFKGPEAAWILNRCQPKILFTLSGFLDIDYMAMLGEQELPKDLRLVLMRGTQQDAMGWDDFISLADNVQEDALEKRLDSVDGKAQLDLMFTSGTTGRPKGVCTGHQQNIKVYDTWSNTVGLNQEDRYLVINPFFHSFGYKAGWLSAIIRGCTIYPVAQFDVTEVLELIQRHKITMLPGPPAIFQSILMHPEWQTYDISSLRLAVTGAASVPVNLIERMRADLKCDQVVTAYGLTESTGVVSICHPDDSAERIARTAGRAMPGVEMRCVDKEGQQVSPGEPGELLVRGFNVMSGYYDDPEATAATINPEGWLHTEDVAVMDEQGYIRITDRIKDIYICGGFNCYPAEIENALCSMEGIMQAAVIGVSDERLGEVGRAFLVADHAAKLNEEVVIKWCRTNMANYKVPRSVIFMDALPMNASGKVLKTELRTHH
jgi:acyl-CoA synthetase (AMP-forming)/AMP-acid ligase II